LSHISFDDTIKTYGIHKHITYSWIIQEMSATIQFRLLIKNNLINVYVYSPLLHYKNQIYKPIMIKV